MNDVTVLIKARQPAIVVDTDEEQRMIKVIRDAFAASPSNHNTKYFEWDTARGLRQHVQTDVEGVREWSAIEAPKEEVDGTLSGKAIERLDALLQIVGFKQFRPETAGLEIYFIVDGDGFLHLPGKEGMLTRQRLKVAIEQVVTKMRVMVFVSKDFQIPAELATRMTKTTYALPTEDELMEMLHAQANDPGVSQRLTVNLADGHAHRIVAAMRGLTMIQATQALFLGLVKARRLDDSIVPTIIEAKKQAVMRSKLQYIDVKAADSEIGGLENLKAMMVGTRRAMTAEARAAGIPRPRGILVVGLPGTGKSLAAKAIAGTAMPLVRLDVGDLYGKHYGDSEAALRGIFQAITAIGECVLWIDEIDKGGLGGAGNVEGRETEGRITAMLLTWMQETKDPVFVIATANTTNGLNEALISRFDAILWVDVPNESARRQIFEIHCVKYNVAMANIDLDELAAATAGYSGREIDKIVTFAIRNAWAAEVAIHTTHMLDALAFVKPVAIMKARELEELRDWGNTWGVPADAQVIDLPRLTRPAAGRANALDLDM